MKKDLIFTPVLLLIGILLFLFRTTGLIGHLVLSGLGLVVLIVYTVLSRKQWEIPALEIAMRVSYGIALITGGVIVKFHTLGFVTPVHRIFAGAFVVLLLALFVHKRVVGEKK